MKEIYITIKQQIIRIQITMPKIIGGFSNSRSTNHRKDNFSMDIKSIYANHPNSSPYIKKHSLKDKLSLNLKQHLVSNTSMNGSNDKKVCSKRRFSLTLAKTTKNSNIGVHDHHSFKSEKLRKIERLIDQQKYQEAAPLIRHLLVNKEELAASRNKLYFLYSQCLIKLNQLKQAEQYLTRYLENNANNYQAMLKRGKIRYEIGAHELGIRDIKNAIYIDNQNPQGYLILSYYYSELRNRKQSLNILIHTLKQGNQSLSIILKALQLCIQGHKIFEDTLQTIQFLETKFWEIANSKRTTPKTEIQCFKGLLCEFRKQENESCIFYEECVKFNGCKNAVTIAIEHLITNKIKERDYYSAYHTITRLKILNTDEKYLQVYVSFLDGVTLIMKKKYQEGITIHENIIAQISKEHLLSKTPPLSIHKKAQNIIEPIIYKFLAFASFKIGKHQRTIHYYEKLQVFGLDECSSYNLLLAEGIVAVEKKKNFQLGIEKFEQSKYIYPNKAEPYIYIAMAIIYREINHSKNKFESISKEELVSAIVHAIQEMNESIQNSGPNSSNLLFHRCILHLFLGEYQDALDDINLCIQKAEENQPKYFYIRGLCYSITRDMKKAVNQFCISLSLSSSYYRSLLERAKCFFLLGETESGFNDLKVYMQANPDDYQVHKWIGDLLYEGYSYHDSYKAYDEIEEGIYYQAELMKVRCLMRTGTLQNITDLFNKLSKMQQCDPKSMQIDSMAINLLKVLAKASQKKEILKKIKSLDKELEENNVGEIFELIDCMDLLGLASLLIGNYEQAYQSFLLGIQLYPSCDQREYNELKSDISEQHYSMSLHDLYLNCVIALIGMKRYEQAITMIKEELIQVNSEKYIKYILQLIKTYESDKKPSQSFTLESAYKKNQHIKLKPIQLKLKHLKLKCYPCFSLFHKNTKQLYAGSVVTRIVKEFHPSYIDNMPEGPWIKRNEYGVIFTDNMVESDIGSSLISSMRDDKKQKQEIQGQNASEHNFSEDTQTQRFDFKKKIALDPAIQKKLNSIINKSGKMEHPSSS